MTELIARLGLQPHPEGGWYRELHRSTGTVRLTRGLRARCTVIYYLLEADTFSAWHRVASDEVWSFLGGDALELHQLDEHGPRRHRLGPDVLGGDEPQVVVPAGVWQAAVTLGAWTLCGCVVAPGFDFADFAMPDRGTLDALFPDHTELVARFSRG